MTRFRVFVSSVQSEFAAERQALRDYFRDDPLMRRFFELFLFEDLPACDRSADSVYYMREVDKADVYVGLFGWGYGSEDEEGVSPTEREFDRASELGVKRLVFVKGRGDAGRHPKMQALIRRAQTDLVRRRFDSTMELQMALYASLLDFLEDRNAVYRGRFDAAPCEGATIGALDHERMVQFIRTARRVRRFAMTEDAPPESFLEHLNLLSNGRPTNAAVLLFGKSVQRHLPTAEVRCAHFHGTWVAKPIPSYQVYQGTVFDMVDRAADFVLDRIDLSVGTRAESIQAPVSYEIPKEVIVEAIVNAVAHRDYASNGSVQVMLFKDRMEVRNPGTLPTRLTLDKLRVPHSSVPTNPLLAHAMYLVAYVERMGTGTLDMIRRCSEAGLLEPEFAVAEGFVTTIRRRRRGQAEEGGPSGGQANDQAGAKQGPSDERGAKRGPSGGRAGAEQRLGEGPSGGQAELKRRARQGTKRGPSGSQAGAERKPSGERGAKQGPSLVKTRAKQSVGRVRAQDSAAGPTLSNRDVRILRAAAAEPAPRSILLAAGRYSGRSGSFGRRIRRLVSHGLLEMTLPGKPTSPSQRYRLTTKGRTALMVAESHRKGDRGRGGQAEDR